MQPAGGQGLVEALERALDSGLRGVGEVLPQAQGFSLDDPWWRRMVELAKERGVPLTLHATDPEAGPAAGPRTPLEGYVRLAREHPGAAFILAHWGGGMAFRGRAGGGRCRPTSTSTRPRRRSSMTAACSGGPRTSSGPGRILYGSDYPLLLTRGFREGRSSGASSER